jgi:hypothetical protein
VTAEGADVSGGMVLRAKLIGRRGTLEAACWVHVAQNGQFDASTARQEVEEWHPIRWEYRLDDGNAESCNAICGMLLAVVV